MTAKEYESHPSYGVIRISRVQGGDDVLFGSSIRHSYKIRISIHQAELIRDELFYDRHFAKESIVEVDMSQSQFAEFVTSMNLGAGTPCTIRRVKEGEKLKTVESCPVTSKREQFDDEFKEEIQNLMSSLKKLKSESEEILDKKSILKSDRTRLRNLIHSMDRIVMDRMPFMATMWSEQMDKTVTDAKGEVEAFTESKLTQAGLASIYKKLEASGHDLIELEVLPPKEE